MLDGTPFERALSFLYPHEVRIPSGWAVDSSDRGQRTRWGLSSRANPDLDLDSIDTWDQAQAVYRERYWTPLHADALPAPLSLVLFDHAVHSGLRSAIFALQHALHIRADGVIGPVTLAAIRNAPLKPLVQQLLHTRADARLAQGDDPTQRVFRRGWIHRVIDLALEASA